MKSRLSLAGFQRPAVARPSSAKFAELTGLTPERTVEYRTNEPAFAVLDTGHWTGLSEKALEAIVIPAKAGIPLRDIKCLPGSWIPACAGMTAFSELPTLETAAHV